MYQEQIGDLVRYDNGDGRVWEGIIISTRQIKFTKVPGYSDKIGGLFDFIPPLCAKHTKWKVIKRADPAFEDRIKMEKRTRFINRIEKRHVKCTK